MLEVIGLQLQFWIIPVIAIFLTLVGCGVFFVLNRRDHGYDVFGWQITGGITLAIGLLFGLIWAGISIPFDSKYHVMYKISGTVESVTNTLESGGDGERSMTPVVNLSGYSDPIEMDNSRIVTLKGREVELVCTLQWVYEGMDITHCNIAAIK